MALPIVIALLLFSAIAVRRRRKRRLPARTMIVSPRQSTATERDGAVRSIQTGELSIPRERLERLWTPANLENLARTYWRFLSRVTLGLIRVVYGENERLVVLLIRQLTLLRFDPPEYELEADHGNVRWKIRDGLLVARAGRPGAGFLALDVRRESEPEAEPAKVRIEVEVANFYPAIAGFSMPVYKATQAIVHVLVTHAFLRSLAKLELAESKVKRLAPEGDPPAGEVAASGTPV